jgi:nicotinate-nucleotide adenylyltransferase
MGGTFDPVHIGHLVAAEEALHAFELDEVAFVPTGAPWQKRDREVSAPEDRYVMTCLATASHPRFNVSRVELERDGPTYTIDTLRSFQEQAGGRSALFFITGADAILQILTWKDPADVLGLATFIAASRPGHELSQLDRLEPSLKERVRSLEIPALAISSTDIRERVRTGRPYRYLVPEDVASYISKRGLYGGGR